MDCHAPPAALRSMMKPISLLELSVQTRFTVAESIACAVRFVGAAGGGLDGVESPELKLNQFQFPRLPLPLAVSNTIRSKCSPAGRLMPALESVCHCDC